MPRVFFERVWAVPGACSRRRLSSVLSASCSCAGRSARGHPGTPTFSITSIVAVGHSAALLLGVWCRALGAGGRVCSPGPPVLLASQRGHPFRASVSMACWDDHSVVVPAFWDGSGSSGRAQGARPAPVCRFHSHFLVQTGVNLSLKKGPVPEMVAAPLPCLILGTGSGAHNVSPRH